MNLFLIDNDILYVATNTLEGFTVEISWFVPHAIFVLSWRFSFSFFTQFFFHCHIYTPRFVSIINTAYSMIHYFFGNEVGIAKSQK